MRADIAFAIAFTIHGFLFSNPKGGIPINLVFEPYLALDLKIYVYARKEAPG